MAIIATFTLQKRPEKVLALPRTDKSDPPKQKKAQPLSYDTAQKHTTQRRFSDRSYNVSDFDDEDLDFWNSGNLDPPGSAVEEGSGSEDDHAQAPDNGSQSKSQESKPSGVGQSEPRPDSPETSSAAVVHEWNRSSTGPISSSDMGKEEGSLMSALRRGPSPLKSAGQGSDIPHWASGMKLGFSPTLGSLHLRRNRASTGVSSPPMVRERTVWGSSPPSPQSNTDLVDTAKKVLDQLSPLPRNMAVPNTPRLNPFELPNTSNFDPSAPQSPTQHNAARPSPRLGPKTLTASFLHISRHAGSKRPASEISDSEEPSASHHENSEEPKTSSSQQPNCSTTAAMQEISWLSDTLDRAENLLPPPTMHQELLKIYSVLRQLARVDTTQFMVVEPHDFIETLSWSHLQPSQTQDIEIIRRLRGDIATEKGQKKKILIPFHHDLDMFLACIELSGRPRVLRIFDPEMTLQDDGSQGAKREAIGGMRRAYKSAGNFGKTPPHLRLLKRCARTDIQEAVAKSLMVAGDFVEEFSHITRLINEMDEKLLETKTKLRYEMYHEVLERLEEIDSEETETWAEVEALNIQASLDLNSFESKLAEMQKCLVEWKADYQEALEHLRTPKKGTKPVRSTQRTCRRLEIERGDLKEIQKALATQRNTEPLSGRKRLNEARKRFRERNRFRFLDTK
ncbi:hypothetical protein VP1G_09787 [Cytospora mali]|uniref:Uncharacterized protein n=1 Tax=Cytospora mali TaxID=578113 RepID=A0A194VF87_CYTMA|nr:hypothetical protein VP1G_09787 [Valsa mali var. pyri (nom. inval.)]